MTDNGMGRIAKRQTLLRATKNRRFSRVIIDHSLKAKNTEKKINEVKTIPRRNNKQFLKLPEIST